MKPSTFLPLLAASLVSAAPGEPAMAARRAADHQEGVAVNGLWLEKTKVGASIQGVFFYIKDSAGKTLSACTNPASPAPLQKDIWVPCVSKEYSFRVRQDQLKDGKYGYSMEIKHDVSPSLSIEGSNQVSLVCHDAWLKVNEECRHDQDLPITLKEAKKERHN